MKKAKGARESTRNMPDTADSRPRKRKEEARKDEDDDVESSEDNQEVAHVYAILNPKALDPTR